MPSVASTPTSNGALRAAPVSTRVGRLPRIRYAAVMFSWPPILVSIMNTLSPRSRTRVETSAIPSAGSVTMSRAYDPVSHRGAGLCRAAAAASVSGGPI